MFPGSDGRVRTVKLQTSKGLLMRTVQRLHKLECLDNTLETKDALDSSEPGPTDQIPDPVVLPKVKVSTAPKKYKNPKVQKPSKQSNETEKVAERSRISRYGRKIKLINTSVYE